MLNITKNSAKFTEPIVRRGLSPDAINVDATSGPQPPPPTASRKPPPAPTIGIDSLREGFGLTVAEAMWKALPVMGGAAAGIRAQVLDGITGRLVDHPENPEAIADTVDAMFVDDKEREVWGRNARDRVSREFLIFGEVRRWWQLMVEVASS